METPASQTPLAGLKVLELGQLIAGPFAAKTLTDFGAEVIKIEPPGAGDPLRKWRLLKDGTSVWWQVQSRNKRSLALDLRAAEGQAIVRQLAAEADVLLRRECLVAEEDDLVRVQQIDDRPERLVVGIPCEVDPPDFGAKRGTRWHD